jgi:hypothetical protein
MFIHELTQKSFAYCSRHRSPATLVFYRARLKTFCREFNDRDMGTLTPLEIEEHVAKAGEGMSDSTRHHDVVALQRLQKFARGCRFQPVMLISPEWSAMDGEDISIRQTTAAMPV